MFWHFWQVDCPAWAQEINCLSADLDVSAAVRAKAHAEYSQVGAAQAFAAAYPVKLCLMSAMSSNVNKS
jgi:hypothetical protein